MSAKKRGKSKSSANGHEAFDAAALMGEGEDFDITPLFEESEEEKEIRRRFYDTTPAKSDQAGVDSYIHTISVGGSLRLQDRLQNRSRVAITITDADGQVIATGIGKITAGFKEHVTKDATIMERAHKAKVIE